MQVSAGANQTMPYPITTVDLIANAMKVTMLLQNVELPPQAAALIKQSRGDVTRVITYQRQSSGGIVAENDVLSSGPWTLFITKGGQSRAPDGTYSRPVLALTRCSH